MTDDQITAAAARRRAAHAALEQYTAASSDVSADLKPTNAEEIDPLIAEVRAADAEWYRLTGNTPDAPKR